MFELLPLDLASAKEALNLFLFLAAELTILFLLISYGVGVLQTLIPPEKIQRLLSAGKGRGYVMAVLLGAMTPFCSCSTIPFLKGLLRAEAGFGTLMTFLFASPLLNPVVIGLFIATFGLDVALIYFVAAVGVSVLAGFVLEKLGFEKHIKVQNSQPSTMEGCRSSCCSKAPEKPWLKIWHSTWGDFKRLSPYLFGGVAIGAFIYGFIPTDLITSIANKENPLAIPIAAVIGIPLYIRAEAVIALSAALAAKGMGVGALMALIIGSAGASLTEVVLLKSLFKNELIAAFLVVVLGMAISAGFTYQLLF